MLLQVNILVLYTTQCGVCIYWSSFRAHKHVGPYYTLVVFNVGNGDHHSNMGQCTAAGHPCDTSSDKQKKKK